MAQIIDVWIADDPSVRPVQILEVVLTYCASVLWPHNSEKVKRVPEWVQMLRTSLENKKKLISPIHTRSPESSANRRHATPKHGRNGLVVASADVIVCQASMKTHQQPTETLPLVPPSQQHSRPPVSPSKVSSHDGTLLQPALVPPSGSGSLDAACGNLSTISRRSTSSSANWLHYPEVGAENNRVRDAHTGPSTSVAVSVSFSTAWRSTEEYFEESGVPPTPATTRDGEVVVVTENGSPLSERRCTSELSSIPLQVKRLSGGITNELFHIYDEDEPSASVVLRVFGKETDRVISRESELFYQSLFIPTHVHGNNFLIYDFLEGYYTLPYQEMAVLAMPIARAIAAFQVRATRAALRDHARPLLRDAQNVEYWDSVEADGVVRDGCFSASLSAQNKRASRFDREGNFLIASLTRWVDLMLSMEFVTKVQEDKRDAFLATGRKLQSECAWMLSMLERVQTFLPEGVCHNDLLSANLMIHKERGDVRVIDFDYTKRCFLLYDVANHFNEYPGLDCDYKTYFPSDEHMSAFIAEYRRGMRAALESAWAEDSFGTATLNGCPPREQQIILNAHELFWTESEDEEEAVSSLDVDFLDYGQIRLKRYLEVRDEFSAGL